MNRVLGVALLLAAACSNRPSTVHCENAVDHMIDIFAAPKVVTGESTKDAEAWKKVLHDKDALRGTLIETCKKKMTDSVASCVLAAQDEVTLATCFSD